VQYQDFQTPDKKFYPRPLWFWNCKPTPENISAIMDNTLEKEAYGGFSILTYASTGLEYLSEEYMQAYGMALESARRNGLTMCLFDEYWFPSGSAGGLLRQKYPEACARKLEKYEYDGQTRDNILLPEGKLMASVAMHMDTGKIIDLKGYIQDGRLTWRAFDPGWKIMLFVCVLSQWDRVNYMDPQAVRKLIEVNYEPFYARFAPYFGTVIDSAFHDEIQMYAVDGKMWTEDFNERFYARYHQKPDHLYPALWYDIGEKTAAARNMLLGLRADMFCEGYPKVVQEWCAAHGIYLTGHVDQEELISPVCITGDLMKVLKHQATSAFDQIWKKRRAHKIYKILSSAANNWDQPLVMSETYGDMQENLPMEIMYDEAMEQYAKGMNLFIPHAVWTDDTKDKIVFQPELSARNPFYKDTLRSFDLCCARLSCLLQGGRHVSDIAVLYPIHGLQTSCHFDWGGSPYLGSPAEDYFDYQDIGEWLSSHVHRDYTFLHPEALDEKCAVYPGRLHMDNAVNFEDYRVLILPGTNTISLSNLEKAYDFYQQGGVVIATSHLPTHSVEEGGDADVTALLADMFDTSPAGSFTLRNNAAGGKAYWIPVPDGALLDQVLADSGVEFDVCMEAMPSAEETICYIHKVKDDRDIYYIANCTGAEQTVRLRLRTAARLEMWNPHDGSRAGLPCEPDGTGLRTSLALPAHRSMVLVTAG